MNTRAKLITKLQDKEYRDAFVNSQINIELAFQIRMLREKRGWTQGQLAEKAGMLQPRISAVETPGKGKLNLETLRRIAAAFDIGLIVRFAPFSEMVEWVEKFNPESFTVVKFDEDIRIGLKTKAVLVTLPGSTQLESEAISPPLAHSAIRRIKQQRKEDSTFPDILPSLSASTPGSGDYFSSQSYQ